MSVLESMLLLAVVGGLLVLALGIVLWAGNRSSDDGAAGASPTEAAAEPGVKVLGGLKRNDPQQDLDRKLKEAEQALQAEKEALEALEALEAEGEPQQ
ncbi:MAG: hypothetical protein ACI8PZ_002941 [Myxococcota bacterium]|jgi:hypothetical protein